MIDKLIIKIRTNSIIEKGYFDDYDIDELLDMRDDEEFDLEWIRIYDILNQIKVGENEQKIIDTIREESFLMAYNLFGSSDIASCISDDFEIICKAYIVQYNDIWLNSLIMSYVNGRFPCGKLKIINYTIKECIDIWIK